MENEKNNFTNRIIIEKNELDFKYLEFLKLKELGVQNIYSLKELDFSTIEENLQQKDNYFKLARLFDIENDKLILIKQTHSKNILILKSDEDLKKNRDNYDGIITNRTDIALATKNADCILFVLYDKKKKVLANIHSGWKGTVQRIIEECLIIFKNEFKSDYKDISVYVSPSIRNCHFEVEEDVKNIFKIEFKEINPNKYIKEKDEQEVQDKKQNKEQININKNNNNNNNKNKKYFIDTIYLNKVMMKKFGILDENIYDSDLCSVCFKNKIYSYRGSDSDDKHKRAIFVAKIK